MKQRKWLFGMSLGISICMVIAGRLFWTTKSAHAAETDTTSDCTEQVDGERPMSDAEWRFRTSQPRHWREYMLRR